MSLPIPNIDLGGVVQVIDDSGERPVWKTIARVPVASETHAQRVAAEHGLKSVWLRDDLGFRKLVSAAKGLLIAASVLLGAGGCKAGSGVGAERSMRFEASGDFVTKYQLASGSFRMAGELTTRR